MGFGGTSLPFDVRFIFIENWGNGEGGGYWSIHPLDGCLNIDGYFRVGGNYWTKFQQHVLSIFSSTIIWLLTLSPIAVFYAYVNILLIHERKIVVTKCFESFCKDIQLNIKWSPLWVKNIWMLYFGSYYVPIHSKTLLR